MISDDEFSLGDVYFSHGVSLKAERDASFWLRCQIFLERFINCDRGNISEEDSNANDRAVKDGGERIVAVYKDKGDVEVMIITEADRSVTTILFPEEY